MKSVSNNSVDELKAYFRGRIRHCYNYALADYFERKVDEEYWDHVSEIEHFLLKKKGQFLALYKKSEGLSAVPSFLDRFIQNLPSNDSSRNHRTNEGIDYRLCISILFAIDVFEKNKIKDLKWLKDLITEISTELVMSPPSHMGYTRDKMPFPSISNETTEDSLNWKKELKYTLRRRLFKKSIKDAQKLFYAKLQESPEYDYKNFFPSNIIHGDTNIDEYYFEKLMPKISKSTRQNRQKD